MLTPRRRSHTIQLPLLLFCKRYHALLNVSADTSTYLSPLSLLTFLLPSCLLKHLPLQCVSPPDSPWYIPRELGMKGSLYTAIVQNHLLSLIVYKEVILRQRSLVFTASRSLSWIRLPCLVYVISQLCGEDQDPEARPKGHSCALAEQ